VKSKIAEDSFSLTCWRDAEVTLLLGREHVAGQRSWDLKPDPVAPSETAIAAFFSAAVANHQSPGTDPCSHKTCTEL
jgi:hypothetical protein